MVYLRLIFQGMIVHKLKSDEFDEIDYNLIAIHTSLEDYRLAYFINKNFPVLLSKSKNEILITVKEGETYFSRFDYYDDEKKLYWELIQNKNKIIQNLPNNNMDLFSNTTIEVSPKVYLLPEFKTVDYFLKIEKSEETFDILKIQQILKTIEAVSTVYTVDPNKIKSKNNLIF